MIVVALALFLYTICLFMFMLMYLNNWKIESLVEFDVSVHNCNLLYTLLPYTEEIESLCLLQWCKRVFFWFLRSLIMFLDRDKELMIRLGWLLGWLWLFTMLQIIIEHTPLQLACQINAIKRGEASICNFRWVVDYVSLVTSIVTLLMNFFCSNQQLLSH